MIILGIDPGIAIVGYGIIEYKNSRFTTLAHGSIQTEAHTDTAKRLQAIYTELDALINEFNEATGLLKAL